MILTVIWLVFDLVIGIALILKIAHRLSDYFINAFTLF